MSGDKNIVTLAAAEYAAFSIYVIKLRVRSYYINIVRYYYFLSVLLDLDLLL